MPNILNRIDWLTLLQSNCILLSKTLVKHSNISKLYYVGPTISNMMFGTNVEDARKVGLYALNAIMLWACTIIIFH